MHDGRAGPKLHSGTESTEGAFQFAEMVQRNRQIKLRLGVIRAQRDRFAELPDRSQMVARAGRRRYLAGCADARRPQFAEPPPRRAKVARTGI
jgi:hypothetical protein